MHSECKRCGAQTTNKVVCDECSTEIKSIKPRKTYSYKTYGMRSGKRYDRFTSNQTRARHA